MHDEYDELSTEETLEKAGLRSLNHALSRSFREGNAPACCECGAYVEPDGHCPHNNPSVILKEKLI